MEYIALLDQQNKYPNVINYTLTSVDKITLTGNFNTNKVEFKIPTLDSLIIVPDTKFRFLLSIDDKIYTSKLYYDELITSINEGNPYFLQSSFLEEFLVKYTPSDIASIIASLKVIENDKKVDVKKNVFVLSDGSYDYISLIKYIDWVVSPIGLSEIETNGVLPAKQLSQYTLPEIPKPQTLVGDVATVEVVEENIQAYQWEYKRIRNLDREPLAVRETQNTTSRELYRINEGEKFIGNLIGDGLVEVFDDARTARVGYIKVSRVYAAARFKRLIGPFNIKIITIKQPSNSTSNTTTPSTPSTGGINRGGGGGGGGASVGSGGGSSYGGGYNNGRDNMGGGNNTRYNQR
jgi:uncharacterized membrane protein YgcG